ncbi:MAG: radical SAM/SPASM domain-containing protein [Myxococcota bacterium]|nr:radical SAM/SPASM domain-containing protein [Myxococcota bacterium]
MKSSRQPPFLGGSYLVLELSNRCNLACVHCAVSEEAHPHHETLGSLNPELARRLFQNLADNNIRFETLILFWLGEPLLNPHFIYIYQSALRFAVRNGIFSKIELHTNAALMDINIIDALINSASVPQVIHFSIDASTAETYLHIKGRDQFIPAVRHTSFFLRTKESRGARWPRSVLQFILGSNNVSEAFSFRDHWLRVLQELKQPVRVVAGRVPSGEDSIIFFRQKDCPTVAEQEKENQIFSQFAQQAGLTLPEKAAKPVPSQNLQPCSGFWKSPVIDWKGNLTFCTRDNTLQNSIGSLQDHSFADLWFGELSRQYRERVCKGDYTGHSICQTCFIPRSLNHTDLSEEDIEKVRLYQGGQ